MIQVVLRYLRMIAWRGRQCTFSLSFSFGSYKGIFDSIVQLFFNYWIVFLNQFRAALPKYINNRLKQTQLIRFHFWRVLRGNKCEPQSEIRFAIAIILLQIIDMQQQQMFSLFILYQRWVNEYMQILNVAFLRRRRNLRRTRVAPYTWTIPRPAES